MLGLTNEGKHDTEEWVSAHGVEYAYAYERSSDLRRWAGVRGIPHAVLFDAAGTVRWSGHPGNLSNGKIQEALAGAFPTPMWEWPKETRGVTRSLSKGKYAKALADARELGPELAAYAEAIQSLVGARIAGLRAAYDAGDYFSALTGAEAAAKDFAGLPEGDVAKGLVADIQHDKEKKAVVAAQEELAKLRQEALETDRKKAASRILDDLEELIADHRGTIVERQGTELARDLREWMLDME